MNQLIQNHAKNKSVYRIIIWFILIFISTVSIAAENDFQFWTNSTVMGSITKKYPKIKYWLEYQGRFGDDASKLSQLLLRPGIGYQVIPTTSFWLGYGWIRTAQPFTVRPIEEHRIWQQILWSKKFSQFTATIRSRLEQRYIQATIHTAWRYRQLFKIAFPIPNHEQFSLIGMDELFYHLNKFNIQNNTGLDQNRAFIGVGLKTTEQSTIEMGYLNQYIKRPLRENFNGNCLYMSLLFNF